MMQTPPSHHLPALLQASKHSCHQTPPAFMLCKHLRGYFFSKFSMFKVCPQAASGWKYLCWLQDKHRAAKHTHTHTHFGCSVGLKPSSQSCKGSCDAPPPPLLSSRLPSLEGKEGGRKDRLMVISKNTLPPSGLVGN